MDLFDIYLKTFPCIQRGYKICKKYVLLKCNDHGVEKWEGEKSVFIMYLSA